MKIVSGIVSYNRLTAEVSGNQQGVRNTQITAQGAGLPHQLPLQISPDGKYLAIGGSVIAVEPAIDLGRCQV